MFDTKKIIETAKKRNNGQKIFILGASVASLVASGDPVTGGGGGTTSVGTAGFTLGDVQGKASLLADIITIGAKGGTVDSGGGNDIINGGILADFMRGGAGVDSLLGGGGLDNLVLIGEEISKDLKLEDITNPNGTGVDLSSLLSLPDIVANAVSDIGIGEIIDGGALGALLFAYGDLDLTKLKTLANITRIEALGGEIKISAQQLKELIDSGDFKELIGDGAAKLLITNDGGDILVDFANVVMKNIASLDIAAGVTLNLDQADLLGLLKIIGSGILKGASGELDLSNVEVAASITTGSAPASGGLAGGAFKKVGGEFLVNHDENQAASQTSHEGGQFDPQVTGLTNGGYAISWNSNINDIANLDNGWILARKQFDKFNDQDSNVGSLTGKTDVGAVPSAITDLNDGQYAISFTQFALQQSGPLANDIRVFNFSEEGFSHGNTEAGKSISQPTKVSTALNNVEASHSDITGLKDGGYAIAWHSIETAGGDTSNAGIKMRTYDKDGIQTHLPININTSVQSQQSNVSIDTLSDGKLIAVWQSDDGSPKAGQGLDSFKYDIKGQVLNPNVTKVGLEFTINTTTVGNQFEPEVAALSDGGFVVVWQSDTDIQAQRFDANANTAGDEFKINTNDSGNVSEFSVAALSSGGYVIVWQSDDHSGGDNDGLVIKAQVYSSTGTAQGDEFSVNNVHVGDQSKPSVAGLTTGGFVVSWQSDDKTSNDKDGTAIKAQVFQPSNFVEPVKAAAKTAAEHSETFSPEILPFEMADFETQAIDSIAEVSNDDWMGDQYDFG